MIENDKSKNQIFNITHGKSRPVREMAEIIKNNFDDVEINYGEKEPFSPKRGTLDISKAKELLGYDPKHPLEKAYPKYIQWYKDTWTKFNK